MISYASPTLTNNVIADNLRDGVYVYDAGSHPVLTNNTIISNTGAGIAGGGTPTITNCIIWANAGTDLPSASATYSAIQTGETAGEGNIVAAPLFVDVATKMSKSVPAVPPRFSFVCHTATQLPAPSVVT